MGSNGEEFMSRLEAHIDLSGSLKLTDKDRDLLKDVDRALAEGLALKRWWEKTNAAGSYAKRVELVREFNESQSSFAFFDEVSLDGQTLPVMGTVDHMLYDKQKDKPTERLRDQFREFILHYFMRVSSYHPPAAIVATGQSRHADVRSYFQPLSWCPAGAYDLAGFGYSQHYFKLRDSGLIGKFRERDWYTIVDLREIRERFDWIIIKVRIFDIGLAFRPFGEQSFSIDLPQTEEFYLVISPDFVTCQDNPSPEVLGRYGFGYAILKREGNRSVFRRSEDIFKTGFQSLNFELDHKGQSTVQLVMAINRPKKVLDMDLNPVTVSVGLADILSFGFASQLLSPMRDTLEKLSPSIGSFDPLTAYMTLAETVSSGISAEQLCISLDTIEKQMLLQNFLQHYDLIVGSIVTWRQTQDWLDPRQLPAQAITGAHP
jgi:hypothetical protein